MTYPHWMYAPDGQQSKIVKNPDEESELVGKGWGNKPIPKQELPKPVVVEDNAPVPAHVHREVLERLNFAEKKLTDQHEAFNTRWNEAREKSAAHTKTLLDEIARLKIQEAELSVRIAELTPIQIKAAEEFGEAPQPLPDPLGEAAAAATPAAPKTRKAK